MLLSRRGLEAPGYELKAPLGLLQSEAQRAFHLVYGAFTLRRWWQITESAIAQ